MTTTRNIVPRADGEGSLGTEEKNWQQGYFKDITVAGKALLDLIYPVGSIKITVNDTAPFADLKFGTWKEVGKGKVLWGSDYTETVGEDGTVTDTTGHKAQEEIDAGLPNITGYPSIGGYHGLSDSAKGAFSVRVLNSGVTVATTPDATMCLASNTFDASQANKIYGKSTTVQPPAYVVHFWERTA